MKELNIDLELLLELSLNESRGEGECYLNLSDGEFSYIPQGIIEAFNDKSKFDALESWEKELAEETENVIMNYNDNYLYIPILDEDVLLKGMKEYVSSLSEEKKNAVNEEVNWDNAFLTFNRALLNQGLLDSYYEFRDEYLKNHLLDWLKENDISCK